MTTELVIFDMDGTVINSEPLAARALVAATAVLSDPLSTDEADAFRGRTVSYVYETLEKREGGELPQAFFDRVKSETIAAFEAGLTATDGVEWAIKEILPTPIALASNGEPDQIDFCLRLTGLMTFFEGSWFSARAVTRPKPAPDLFLHTAAQLGADPGHCVVVEDTDVGIIAALEAGMGVIGFSGNAPDNYDALAATGAKVIRSMSELPALVNG